jgi:hypothetical protein
MNALFWSLLGAFVSAIAVPTSVHNWLDAKGAALVEKIRAKISKPAAPK